MRHLAALTGTILLIESLVAPTTVQATILRQEEIADNQALNYIAMVPSEAWIVKSLYKVGLPFVYRPRWRPAHEDFRGSLWKRRMRTVLVASRVEVRRWGAWLVAEPDDSGRAMWYRWPLGPLLRVAAVRRLADRWRGMSGE
jgi:hypothetical protein